jgi:hypothetical protein
MIEKGEDIFTEKNYNLLLSDNYGNKSLFLIHYFLKILFIIFL